MRSRPSGEHAREAALGAVCVILFLTFLDYTIVRVALVFAQSADQLARWPRRPETG